MPISNKKFYFYSALLFFSQKKNKMSTNKENAHAVVSCILNSYKTSLQGSLHSTESPPSLAMVSAVASGSVSLVSVIFMYCIHNIYTSASVG